MNKLATLTSVSVLALLSFNSCKKDNNNNSSNPPSKLNELFTALKSTPQSYTVQSGNFETITTPEGLVLNFYPHSFLDANNNIVPANKTIKIELLPTLDYNTMLLNRVQTATESQQRLISGGAFHIKATLDDQPLKANTYGAMFPAGDVMPTSPMALFTGYEQQELGGNSVLWYDDTTSTTTAKRVQDNGTSNAFAYIFDSVTNFGWINCDFFYADSRPKTDIGVTFPNNQYTDKNTEVYVVFPNINSTTKMYNYLSASNSFTFGYVGYHLPIGETIHVVTMSERNNIYYFSQQSNVTVVNNLTVNVTPEEVNLNTIVNAIANL